MSFFRDTDDSLIAFNNGLSKSNTPKNFLELDLNEGVWVKLNDVGKRILNDKIKIQQRLNSNFKNPIKKTDPDGYTIWQLWCLMEIFGQNVGCGEDKPFDHIKIPIRTK